mgnify:CR=1 FL=1
MIFLFGLGKKADGFVISKSLYDNQKELNQIYGLERLLSPHEGTEIYASFSTTEPFITDMLPTDKEKKKSEKLQTKFAISESQADDLLLAKNLGCPLAMSDKEVWLSKAAKKLGIRIKIIK